jgi:hypothetical protein
VGAVAFDDDVEFLLSQSSLVEFSLLPVEDGQYGLVVCVLGHVDVAFEVTHQDAVFATTLAVCHHQVLVVRVHYVPFEFEQLLWLLLDQFPGVGVNLDREVNSRWVY